MRTEVNEGNNGYFTVNTYDDRGRRVRFETSNGYWDTMEWNDQNEMIRFENSNGVVHRLRPKSEW